MAGTIQREPPFTKATWDSATNPSFGIATIDELEGLRDVLALHDLRRSVS
ncbi:MAG: hypothetical protein QM762_08315 [Chryseolinea sp.]